MAIITRSGRGGDATTSNQRRIMDGDVVVQEDKIPSNVVQANEEVRIDIDENVEETQEEVNPSREQAIMEEFEKLMPVSTSVEKQQEQQHKMFLVITLDGLPNDPDSVRDQILASPTVPIVDELFSRLLCLAATPSHPVISSQILDSSVLASQTVDNRTSQTMENRRRGGHFGRSRPKCSYCQNFGHTREVCYSLHGRPPKNAYVAIPRLHFSTLGPWVMDSGAFDHISDNKSLLLNIVYSQYLPTIILANGCQTKAKGVGPANPLSSVALDSDRGTGQMIDIRRESESLYYLNSLNPSTTCLVTYPPNPIHRRLGYLSLSKLQRMVPSLSSLSTLDSSGPADSRPTPDPAPTANLFLSSTPIALRKGEGLSHPEWRQAMIDEMSALHTSGTLELVSIASGKSTVGCHWIYAVKVGPDGQVDRLKARLVAKEYT
ncbi:uncharacterized protein [Nicotiana tomentosiformis]|uniref:uncharacterized protein n=1 Tax=Nicotiana tomentosiformis TaxID=4098 RepID=UPI00388C4A30